MPKFFGQKQQMYYQFGVVPKVLEISKFAQNEIATHLPCLGEAGTLTKIVWWSHWDAVEQRHRKKLGKFQVKTWVCLVGVPWQITIKPPFGRICSTLSRHLTSKSKTRNGNVWSNKSVKKGLEISILNESKGVVEDDFAHNEVCFLHIFKSWKGNTLHCVTVYGVALHLRCFLVNYLQLVLHPFASRHLNSETQGRLVGWII